MKTKFLLFLLTIFIVSSCESQNIKDLLLDQEEIYDLSGSYIIWEMDEGSDGLTTDLSGNGNHGAYNPTFTALTSVYKKLGTRAWYNFGSNDYSVSNTSSLSDITNYTVSVWWYGNVSSSDGQSLLWVLGGTDAAIITENTIDPSKNDLTFGTSLGGGYQITSTIEYAFSDLVWNHIVIVRTPSYSKGYINGVLAFNLSFGSNLVDLENRHFYLAYYSVTDFVGHGIWDQTCVWLRVVDEPSLDYLNNDNNGRLSINW